jgi:hypothetical protein
MDMQQMIQQPLAWGKEMNASQAEMKADQAEAKQEDLLPRMEAKQIHSLWHSV